MKPPAEGCALRHSLETRSKAAERPPPHVDVQQTLNAAVFQENRTVMTHIHTSGVDARVHEGSHAKVGQDEEEDQAIVERHSGRDDL